MGCLIYPGPDFGTQVILSDDGYKLLNKRSSLYNGIENLELRHAGYKMHALLLLCPFKVEFIYDTMELEDLKLSKGDIG